MHRNPQDSANNQRLAMIRALLTETSDWIILSAISRIGVANYNVTLRALIETCGPLSYRMLDTER